MTDKLPPHNLEAEQGVLGSILLDNDALHDVAGLLEAGDFWRDVHQVLYRAIVGLYEAGQPADAVTVTAELERRGESDRVDVDYLAEVIQGVPHAANAVYHAQIVREKAVARRLIAGCTETIQECYAAQQTAAELVDAAERRVFAVADSQVQNDVAVAADVAPETLRRIFSRAEGGHALTGLATGFEALDAMTSGLQPEQLVIVAARPSMGKTAFALNVAEHAALGLGRPVLVVSLEMGRHELMERTLCSRAHVDGSRVRSGRGLGRDDRGKLTRAYERIVAAPLVIDDAPSRSVLQIMAAARRMKSRRGLSLIVVDYIQLVDTEPGRDNRQEQVAKISRRLKALAREVECPVVALSQLNRMVEAREDKRPRMADLRESGAIEQDADLVLLLHRPEYYDPDDQPGVAELIVAKNRNGATGTVRLAFRRRQTRFEGVCDDISSEASDDHDRF